MEIELIGVPLYYGCDNPGTQLAWDTFLDNGLVAIAQKHGLNIADSLRIDVPQAIQKDVCPTMKFLKEIQIVSRRLEQAVADCLARGHFPLVIGGDHSLGIGSLAGVSQHSSPDDLSVIWVDAHTDINTELTSDSHNIHGMPLSAALGMGNPALYECCSHPAPYLLPENLYYIGARSIDPGEWKIIRDFNISLYGMDSIQSQGIKAVTDSVLSQIKTKHIHVSFDVDFMDSALYSATGLPVPNGPSPLDAQICLDTLLQSGKVISMDFVEYSPRHDSPEKSGLATCFQLLDRCFSTLSRLTVPPSIPCFSSPVNQLSGFLPL